MLNNTNLSKLNVTGQNSTSLMISNTALSSWFTKNPIGKYLSVDWSKAKKATIGHVAVVTVPITHISLPSSTNSAVSSTAGKSANDLSASGTTAETLSNFDPYHPPALYFFQDKTSAHPDSVLGTLMNFTPDDWTKEDGANKIWTGKLMEWNMQSDSVLVHHLTKSKIDGRYLMSSSLTNSDATKKSVNNVVKVNTFLADILGILKTIVEAVGYIFGVPGDYNYAYHGTLTECDFLWGLFCGDGDYGSGGGGSGSPANYSPTAIVYQQYVPGYDGNNSSSGDWSNYYFDQTDFQNNNPCGGGTGGLSVGSQGKKVQVVQGGADCGGTEIYVTTAMVINATAVNYQLNSDQQYWLNNHSDIFYKVSNFINTNDNIGLTYQDAMDYWNTAIWEMSQNGMSFEDFQAQFMTPGISMDDIGGFTGENDDDPNEDDLQVSNPPDRYIPTSFIINGQTVNVYFEQSDDKVSAYQKVYFLLPSLIESALYSYPLQYVPGAPPIRSISIRCTTNGIHTTAKSNHFKGLAIDISKINGVPVKVLGASPEVIALQMAFDYTGSGYCRENFGPYFKHKNGSPWPTTDGSNHIHISVQP